jgi:hypothetical protein
MSQWDWNGIWGDAPFRPGEDGDTRFATDADLNDLESRLEAALYDARRWKGHHETQVRWKRAGRAKMQAHYEDKNATLTSTLEFRDEAASMADERLVRIGAIERERDNAEGRARRYMYALEAIIIRCAEGDKRTDWLPTIASIARHALEGTD